MYGERENNSSYCRHLALLAARREMAEARYGMANGKMLLNVSSSCADTTQGIERRKSSDKCA